MVDGGRLYVRLEDEDDRVLQAVAVDLRPLLSRADGLVEARLRGRIKAHHLRLGLDSGVRDEQSGRKKK